MAARIDTVPKFELSEQEVELMSQELEEYHAIFSPLYQRREQRERSLLYQQGLLSNLPRKAAETMVLHLKGDQPNEVRALQSFVSQGSWSDSLLLESLCIEVDSTLGEDDGVLLLDGSDFPKQGNHSVGVKRQRCGQLGKTANCQAGVFLGYASSLGYALLNRRLYMPKEWLHDDDFSQLREDCGVPEDLEFKTKQELGFEMIQDLVHSGQLRHRWLACDEAFGIDTQFLDKVDGLGIWYFAEISCTTRFWLSRPKMEIPSRKPTQGRAPTKKRVLEEEPKPQQVQDLIAGLGAKSWSRMLIKEGSQGPMLADFAFLRVVGVRKGEPGPEVWLVVRRNLADGQLKYLVSNAAAELETSVLCKMTGMRWPIEMCFEDGKQLVGMGDYEVRGWLGWHHHMTMVILAYFFLIKMKVKHQEKAPALTVPQVQLLLSIVLPKREYDTQLALEILRYRQRRNHAAYLSHRKQRMHRMKGMETSGRLGQSCGGTAFSTEPSL